MDKDEALRLALQALIEVRDANIHGLTLTQDYHEAITAIKAALEEKNEPVAWAMLHDNGHFIDAIHPNEHARVEGEYITPLYTTPPQRTWVGLTDEEITELHHKIKVQLMGTYKTEDIYRAIEAKLKEKNK
jgi:pyruvate/2-oxoglutarate dehydrogenase complex dihydrolipoamide dehydrogenase (E3) component